MSSNGSLPTHDRPNGVQQLDVKNPLNIVIVGAGIGGLSAAIFLRQQGHNVALLEQSRFANEVGAAVHMAPNAAGLLERMGLNARDTGAVECTRMKSLESNGEIMFDIPVWQTRMKWQHPWFLAHRVDLHTELKRLATSEEGEGKPASLRTSSRVAKVTTDGTVILASGEEIKADVVVGADGVHSKTRYALPGSEGIKPFSSGQSAFRFTMPRSQALEDPVTKPLVGVEGQMTFYVGLDRRIVIYPTRHNEILNFVCIHNTKDYEISRDDAESGGWHNTGHLDRLLELYKEFDPALLALLSKANKDSLKVWELLDMEKLPTWTEDRLALIGDAAHPFTPHQGQGAAQAIEDAASLACVLPLGTPPTEIPARLKIYDKCRYGRASKIQEYSRIVGMGGGAGPFLNHEEYRDNNFGHDEWHYTSQKLREWEWEKSPAAHRRMPVPFGPFPGPRQDYAGRRRDGGDEATFSTVSVKFRTSRTLLEGLFPTKAFRFAVPDTNCFATFSWSSLGNLEWLGGHGYNQFGLYIHGVEYTKENGATVKGAYVPILFENLADSIISGREELGLPKVFADLDVSRAVDSCRLTAGWMGNNFLDLSLTGLSEMAGTNNAQNGSTASLQEDLLFYKYIPATATHDGEVRGADVEYAGIIPYEENSKAPKIVERTLHAKKTEVRFVALDQKRLPTLHHIIERLVEIPIYEIIEAKIFDGTGGSDARAARRLE